MYINYFRILIIRNTIFFVLNKKTLVFVVIMSVKLSCCDYFYDDMTQMVVEQSVHVICGK